MVNTKRRANALAAKLAWEREQAKLPGVFIPIRVNNPLNHLRHWWKISRERNEQKTATLAYCGRGQIPTALPATVTLTRYSPREMDDDNLRAALKSCRDQVAAIFGVDDRQGAGLSFQYRQEKGPGYGVRVVVEPKQ
jgi:hypothetical protein